MQSVDVLDDQRPERRNLDTDINENIDNNNNDDNTSQEINEKKLYQVNDNVNSNNPSQRSGSYMIEKPQN